MAATLKQVAASAGVSYQTVWRALHGAPDIAPQTRATVLEAAAKLDYRPNRIAGSLRTNRSLTIGLVVLDVRHAHAGELASGVEEAAAEQGFSVLLANSGHDGEREAKAVRLFLERRVDGIIISPAAGADHRYLQAALPPGLPMVAVNRRLRGYACHTVLSRDADLRLAVQYLTGLGHTRIGALFGDLRIPPFRGRHRAFVAAMQDSGLAVCPGWVRSQVNSVALARAATQEIVSGRGRPTALLAAGSLLTEGALRGLKAAGLQHGSGVMLVGYDLRYAGLLDPPLPVLLQPAREMGRVAIEALLKLANGQTLSATSRIGLSLQTD